MNTPMERDKSYPLKYSGTLRKIATNKAEIEFNTRTILVKTLRVEGLLHSQLIIFFIFPLMN